MPELPEVETVKNGLQTLLVGQRVTSVWHDWPKSFPNEPTHVENFLVDALVTRVTRRAKLLIIHLDNGYTLLTHLKMTGQLVYKDGTKRFGAGHPNDSLIGKLPDKTTRVIISFQSGGTLFFNDQRKFGWIRLLPLRQIEELPFFKKLGPEPLDPKFTAQDFKTRIQRRKNSSIKAVLLDQSVIAGIGNIYADEALWDSRLHPATVVSTITTRKLNTLFSMLQSVLRLSIKKGGSTDRNYVNAEGKKGSYISFAKVFRREGQPCLRCGTIIQKIRVAGRGTHICPKCQKAKPWYAR